MPSCAASRRGPPPALGPVAGGEVEQCHRARPAAAALRSPRLARLLATLGEALRPAAARCPPVGVPRRAAVGDIGGAAHEHLRTALRRRRPHAALALPESPQRLPLAGGDTPAPGADHAAPLPGGAAPPPPSPSQNRGGASSWRSKIRPRRAKSTPLSS